MQPNLAVPADQRKPNLTEQVMEHVRTSVISGTMAPGEWYSVYQLADQLNFSRSPVRDGLLRLEEAGMIQFVKNRGFRVIPTTPADVAEIFSIRIALEVPAARRAARAGGAACLAELRAAMDLAAADDNEELFFRLDHELHDAILVAGGARRAREVIDRLRSATRLLGASTAQSHRGYADITREHDPILEAIGRQDAEAAGAAMRDHLISTGRLLVDQALQRTGGSEDADELWDRLTAGYLS